MKTRYPHILMLALLSSFLLGSCKTFNLADIPNEPSQSEKLPPLVPEFDKHSFGPLYADVYEIPARVLTGTANVNTIVNGLAQSYTISEDTKRIYQRFLLKNICERVGESKGFAVCRMGIRSKGIKQPIFPIISVLTFGIPNLFGMKYATFRDELEVIVDVYNHDDKVIASYSGMGEGEADARLYKGYTKRDAKRTAHALAFTKAMEEIQDQMIVDRSKIIEILN